MVSPQNIASFDETHSHSIHFNDSHTEERNTMRSVPNRRSPNRRPNFGQIHYSQCIGETYE